MEQAVDPTSPSAESVAPAELAAILAAAQQRALEQRLAVEQLLNEARSLEERLTAESLAAQAAVERVAAREHAAAAIAAAQLEREAILRVDACATHAAELAEQRTAQEGAVSAARTAHEKALTEVGECERLLEEARMQLAQAVSAQDEADSNLSAVAAAQTAAETEAAKLAAELAEHRAARQSAENASAEAEARARALGAGDDEANAPSLEAVEELRLFEARVALRAEAAKRAAERRASDLARTHAAN